MSKSSKFVITIKPTGKAKNDGSVKNNDKVIVKTKTGSDKSDKTESHKESGPIPVKPRSDSIVKPSQVKATPNPVKANPVKLVPVKPVAAKLAPVVDKKNPDDRATKKPAQPVKLIKTMVTRPANKPEEGPFDSKNTKEVNTIKVVLEDKLVEKTEPTVFQQRNTMQPRKIIKKSLTSSLSERSFASQTNSDSTTHVKTNETDSKPNLEETEQKESKALVEDCINIISQCDPNQNCSKDELIARVAYQYKTLVKQENMYNERNKNNSDTAPSEFDIERKQKILAMEKILTDLNAAWNKEHLDVMADVREKQNQIVLKNKMEPKMFAMKIDLTSEKKPGEVDKHVALVGDSRLYWQREAKKKIGPPPADKKAIFEKTRGNQKLPTDIQKKIYGRER